jgi:hypothetical protein
VDAVERVLDDGHLRERLTSRGLQLAAELTLEAQSERVFGFVARAVSAYPVEPSQRSRLARLVRRNSSS